MNLRTTLPALAVLAVAATACASDDPEAADDRTTAPSAAPAVTAVGLEELPLLHGWPTRAELGSEGTITGPGPGLEPLVLRACGRVYRFDAPQRLDARLVGLEDERSRAIGRYPDRSAADAAAADLVGLFERCPEEPQDALTEVHRVAGEPASEGGAVVTTSFRYAGAAAIGGEAIVLVQRGTTLVLSTLSREGLGQSAARALAREQVRQLRPLVDELG